MSRIVKQPDIRKDEILETAKKLFYTKGFQKTSIQDIVTSLNIAQGTFYYYFSSKMDVLDKMTDKVLKDIIKRLKEIINEDGNAIKKLNKFFGTTASIKMANRDTIFVLLQVLYKDENAVIRQKMNDKSIEQASPLYAKVIKQGTREGVFKTPFPEVAGEIVMEIIINANEAISKLLLQKADRKKKIKLIKNRMDMFVHTIEKILGTAPGAFKGFDIKDIENLLSES